MKKFNKSMIIGKKQIVLAGLVLMLVGAVYVNYLYADPATDDYLLANRPGTEVTKPDQGTDSDKNYGDAALVSTGVDSQEYFTKAAMERTRSRDEAIETVKTLMKNEDSTDEDLEQAREKIANITQRIESETKIETLIRAKGFEECVVYLNNDAANVVVRSDGLEAEQVAQIRNIIVEEKGILPQNISIQEVS